MKQSLSILLILLISFTSALAVELPATGTANTKSVRLRGKAGPTGKQIATLEKGESVNVLEEITLKSGAVWYKVETAKGKTGYVLSEYLSIPETQLIDEAKESEQAKEMTLKITATCKNINGVGKNWSHYYEWNGLTVKDGKMVVTIAPGVDMVLYARIREQDSKPDTGSEKTTYTVTEKDIKNKKGFTVTQSVTVTENGGRNRGKSAVWTVKYTFTPAKKEK